MFMSYHYDYAMSLLKCLLFIRVCLSLFFRFGSVLSPLVLLDIMRRREKRHDECSMGRNRTSK